MNEENRKRWLAAKERQQQTLVTAEAHLKHCAALVRNDASTEAEKAAAFAAADAAIAARWQADGDYWNVFAEVHGL